MTKRLLLVGGVLALALVAGVGSLYAQGSSQINITVAFPFTVGKVDLPAGDYAIERDNPSVLHVHGRDTTASPLAIVQVITRLAVPSGAATQAAACFDKIGGKYILSEVWIPGEDGYLVATTGGGHTHEVVKGMYPNVK
jgi:hypothetical protein